MLRNSISRAFTLIETLIYAALLLFILAVIYSSLLMALKAYRRTENFADLQQQAMVASRQLIEECASSPATCVRAEASGLVFLSARDPGGRITYASDGRALWRKWVCYYWNPLSGTLLRKQLGITPTADPPTVVPLVATISNNSALAIQRVASRVTGLTLAPTSDPGVAVTLTTSDPEASITISGRVTFRQ